MQTLGVIEELDSVGSEKIDWRGGRGGGGGGRGGRVVDFISKINDMETVAPRRHTKRNIPYFIYVVITKMHIGT